MSTNKYSSLLVEKKQGVSILTLNRPDVLNALNAVTLSELSDAIDDLENDTDIKAVIVTGAGRAFVAGADIKEMKDMTPLEAKKFSAWGHKILKKIENSRLPYIAAVNGHALGGGCELMLACDIRIASKNAKMGQPEINLGVLPGFGGTQRLPRLVGAGLAKELLYTGRIIDAEEAYAMGLVNKVVEGEKLMEETQKLANTIAGKSSLIIEWIKSLVNEGINIDIEKACSLEKTIFSLCFATRDQREGMMAFLEKRPPQFKNS